MEYAQMVCGHLSAYRENVLGIARTGVFHYRGRSVGLPHILPIELRRENILAEFREHFFASEYANIKLHRYFHHLNSSQALCINLLYPLIHENALALFFAYLGMKMAAPVTYGFERHSEIEVCRRPTSFDFFIEAESGFRIFVEAKYTEREFGAAKDDEAHRMKFRQTYLPLVVRSPYLADAYRDEAFFLRHYQIMRNLVHIGPQTSEVLLFPVGNKTIA